MTPIKPSSYLLLPNKFYQKTEAHRFPNVQLLAWNQNLATELNLASLPWSDQDKAKIFSAQTLLEGITPVAQTYSGHQFGHFSAQLGDGRALLLAEVLDQNNQPKDIHLKGSGPTVFSRRGDGRATLKSVIREYIVSEGMFALGIPTSRTLAVIGTGEKVIRETELPGAVLVRVASSHIRVGTFEYFAARGDHEAVRQLADYAIQRHAPDLSGQKDQYLLFFEKIIRRQAELVAQWMQVGFIHGVMNTDNTTISGETLDYGPCAFMEAYAPLTVFSSIDHQGRYAYARQPQILQWNLTALGHAMLSLFSEDQSKAIELIEEKLLAFEDIFQDAWLSRMGQKLGLSKATLKDVILIQDYLGLLHKYSVDFTLGFRRLGDQLQPQLKTPAHLGELFLNGETIQWIEKWKLRLQEESVDLAQIKRSMDQINPVLIPRNHRVEQALAAASENQNFAPMHRLIKALQQPFTDDAEFADLQAPAKPEEAVTETFCGT